ncbi:MAG TPA: S41 family peptidase [Gemmatimonadaceae bacterium]|nr:S41 family peptidase [Gemmatimonadaceae bacterium]
MTTRQRAAIAGVLLLPLLAGAFFHDSVDNRRGVRLFDQVLSLVSGQYVDSLGAGSLYEKAARGLVREIQDPYAALYSPEELRAFTLTTGGRYGGLGMLVEDQQGTVVVSRVYPHTPAEGAGVREGDMIIGVEGASTKGWKLVQVTDSLKGEPGTKVRVSFNRPGVTAPINVEFTRAVIHIPAVPYAIMFDGKVGYIPLLQFNETAANEVERSLKRLTAEGAHGIVLDMRGNGGGIVDQAVAISNLFLKGGQEIFSVRGRGGENQIYKASGNPLAPTIPLVILTDGYTASASEIVTGALQDHDRALVVGTTSFGKGLVQSLFPLDGGWALKLTTAKWYTPSGRSIQKERQLVDGRLVEVVDSMETDSVRKSRPVYHSDAGRIVYGGGAITPDIIVRPDTLNEIEQRFLRTVAQKSQEFHVALYEYSFQLKDSVKPGFVVGPAWRNELYRRITKAGVEVERPLYDSASTEVDRLLGGQVARLAFGDSTAQRRAIADDAQLMRALDIIRRGETQQDLFAGVSPGKR